MFIEKTDERMREESYSEPVGVQTARLIIDVELGGIIIEKHLLPRVVVEARLRGVEVRVWRKGGDVFVTAERDTKVRIREPKAELVISAPEYCEIQARIVTGSIEINHLGAGVRTHVITGQTKLNQLQGPINASSVTGSIQYRGLLADHLHRFMATTGSVQLLLQEPPDARIYAWATTGRVHCGLALSEERRGGYPTGDHLYGVCGSGAGRILAEVTTGSVHITGRPSY